MQNDLLFLCMQTTMKGGITLPTDVEHFCIVCGATQNLGQCSRCQRAYYCKGKECQRKDWPMHKISCYRPDATEADAVKDGMLHFRILNERADRAIDTHGTDTGAAHRDSDGLRQFVQRLGLDAKTMEMTYSDPTKAGSYGRCAANVRLIIKEWGGDAVYGWALYEGEYMYEAEMHVVWRPPVPNRNHPCRNKLINVTCAYGMTCPSSGYFVPDIACKAYADATGNSLSNVVLWK
jgi:hypothetical protein